MEVLKTFKNIVTNETIKICKVEIEPDKFHAIALWEDHEHYGYYNINRESISDAIADLEKKYSTDDWHQV